MSTVVDQGVHHFLFISDEHIVKQSKSSMLQIIFINSLFIIYYDILKVLNIVGKRKSVDTMRKVASLRSYFSYGFTSLLIFDYPVRCTSTTLVKLGRSTAVPSATSWPTWRGRCTRTSTACTMCIPVTCATMRQRILWSSSITKILDTRRSETSAVISASFMQCLDLNHLKAPNLESFNLESLIIIIFIHFHLLFINFCTFVLISANFHL